MDFIRLFHTIRHLKPVQIYGRLLYHGWPTRAGTGPAPKRRGLAGEWVAPIARNKTLFGPTLVRFLNCDGCIETQAQWNSPSQSKLWLYNLHYFDDFNSIDSHSRSDWHCRLVDRWIAENPPGHGNGWEPYPTSIRLVNWIKWALGGVALQKTWGDSLACQTRWLENCIEWHLLGNHLLANAKALVFAGLFFEGPEAERWLSRGVEIYRQQLPEQILADGGHIERSPMYHAIVLEDLLDVLNASRLFGFGESKLLSNLPEMIAQMRVWLNVMTHPDGQISFFNDAAFSISGTPAALEDYAIRLGLGASSKPSDAIVKLSSSGYVRLQVDDAVVILDAAPIGPDYLSGHAHADTLSFELSLGIERIVVNGGTSIYGSSSERERERSTAAHSTVEIDGENSSEVWSGFRVARRARVHNLATAQKLGCVIVSAGHDGYARLKGRPIHERSWTLGPGRLAISDRIVGRSRRAVARFHLGPGIDILTGAELSSGSLVTVSKRQLWWQASTPVTIEKSLWHPEFGQSVPMQTLAFTFTGLGSEAMFTW